jgi:putative nucleotidyltransferase with HDIG domain
LLKVMERRDDWFHRELVDTFLGLARSEAFWFRLESEQVAGYAATWVSQEETRELSFKDLRSLVHVFAVIVDAKSPFTRRHSDAVAKLSRYLGERMGLSLQHCEMIELAGLLHDLGKLRVPDEYLEKPGKLTPEEYAIVRRHSFDTFNILKNIKGIEEIALWAAQHHERLDGSGYPDHLGQGQTSLEARIIAVADVFQALEQERPYRGSLEADAILEILKDSVVSGRLDGSIVACIEANLENCWRIGASEY